MSELYPNSTQIKPMKYGKAAENWQEVVKSGEYVAQTKKDGAHYILEKTNDGQIYLFGRTVSKVTGEMTEKSANIPHICLWAKENLSNGTILCGEIYYPGKTSKDVTKVMGAKPEKAIDRQENLYGLIHYYIFDCLKFNKEDLMNKPFIERFNYISDLYKDETVRRPYYIEYAFPCAGNIPATINRWLEQGEEGAVVKKKDGLYIPDKRPTENFKVKQKVDSIDVVITGLLDPQREYRGKESDIWQYRDVAGNLITKSAYYGWKDGISIGAYQDGELITFGKVTSGITDAMKEDMTKHPHKYIGHTCSIQCMSVDKKEQTLRHAFFLSLREDKDPSDCLLSDIF